MSRWTGALIAAGFFSALGLGLFSASQDGLPELLFARSSYYVMAVLFVVWCFSCFKVLGKLEEDERRILIPDRGGWLICGLLAFVVLVSVPIYHRVQIDDADLVGVARSFFFEQRADFARMIRPDTLGPLEVSRLIPTRPVFFPFLLHITYFITGAHHGAAFVLNGFLLLLLLLGVYRLTQNLWGKSAAIAAVILAAGQPVISQSAASGGYDLFFTWMLLLAFLLFWLYIRKPGPARLAALWIQLLVLAHIRYEGSLYLVLIAIAAVITVRPKMKWFSAFYYGVTPFFILPVFWQRFFVRDEFYLRGKDSAAFSFENMIQNSRDAVATMGDFSYRHSYPPLINMLGLAGLIICLFVLIRRWKAMSREKKALFSLTAVCLFAYGTLLLLFANSNVNRPSPARLYILAELVLTLTAIGGACVVLKERRRGGALVLSALFLFFLYHPTSIINWHAHTLTVPREERMTVSFLKKKEFEQPFLIHQWPRIFTARGIPAVDYAYANKNRELLLSGLQGENITDLLAVQEIRVKTGKPFAGETLHRMFETETLFETGHRSGAFLRISRILPPESSEEA